MKKHEIKIGARVAGRPSGIHVIVDMVAVEGVYWWALGLDLLSPPTRWVWLTQGQLESDLYTLAVVKPRVGDIVRLNGFKSPKLDRKLVAQFDDGIAWGVVTSINPSHYECYPLSEMVVVNEP